MAARINTSTTILTFVLGVLILLEANRQAKESKVVHDELLEHVRTSEPVVDAIVDVLPLTGGGRV